MEAEITEMILTLQIQDLNDEIQNRKGKAREDQSLSDGELALQAQQQEFERTITELADRRMARSMSLAVQDDGASVVILAGEESRAAADRELACRLSGQVSRPVPLMLNLKADNSSLSLYSALNVDDVDDEDDNASTSMVGQSSALFATRRESLLGRSGQCVACNEN